MSIVTFIDKAVTLSLLLVVIILRTNAFQIIHQQSPTTQRCISQSISNNVDSYAPKRRTLVHNNKFHQLYSSASSSSQSTGSISLEGISENFMKYIDVKEITRTCKVRVGPIVGDITTKRLGLIATQAISKGDVALSIPYDDRYELRADIAKNVVYNDYITDEYTAWTGDAGYIALMILNELVRATTTNSDQVGIPLPKNRSKSIQEFITAWILTLPSPTEMAYHPVLWKEDDQEVLQSSTTNKIYKQLDDIEDDVAWLTTNIFENDRTKFPETVVWNDQTVPCFTLDGFRWAMALAQSRSFFLDGKLRLVPFVDMCNHSDDCNEEVQDSKFGPFFATKGAQIVASQNVAVGDEVCVSYGPKSAADYLLENGFIPDQCWSNAVCELTFEIDPNDRFHDDKLDILEYETYDQAPMDPVQSFDIISTPARDGEPDPAMIQFLRLVKLGKTDAFLLESIFRREVWDFMSLPVSEQNELDVINEIIDTCNKVLDDFNSVIPGGPEICTKLRALETKALQRTIAYLEREKQAVDLKEYYQQRRLRDLGLDSAWAPDEGGDDMDTLSFGQTRRPGGSDFDW